MSSSPLTLLDRAAYAPRWMLVVLAVVAVSATLVVAVHRHTIGAMQTQPVAADLQPAAAAADTVRREPATSRSLDRTAVRVPVQRVRPTAPVVRKPLPDMPIATSNAAETVAAAKASTYNTPGQCLGWSREQADIPSLYATAAIAWEHAAGRHPGDLDPPPGAAVYWTGGSSGAGHVAISVGHGMVRSSDAGGSGVVATVSLQSITDDWHLQYAGWADSINGYLIPGVDGA